MMEFADALVNYPERSIMFKNLSENISKDSQAVSVKCENSMLSVVKRGKIEGVINKFRR